MKLTDGVIGDGLEQVLLIDITSDNDSVYAAGAASVDSRSLQLQDEAYGGVMVMDLEQVLLQ